MSSEARSSSLQSLGRSVSTPARPASHQALAQFGHPKSPHVGRAALELMCIVLQGLMGAHLYRTRDLRNAGL